jgi:hypothetical protein
MDSRVVRSCAAGRVFGRRAAKKAAGQRASGTQVLTGKRHEPAAMGERKLFSGKLRKCGACATTELAPNRRDGWGLVGLGGVVSATPLYMSRTYFYPAILYALT